MMTWFLSLASKVVVNSVVRDSVNSSLILEVSEVSTSVFTTGVSKLAETPTPQENSLPVEVDWV